MIIPSACNCWNIWIFAISFSRSSPELQSIIRYPFLYASSSTAFASSLKKGFSISGTMAPIIFDDCLYSALASSFGRNPVSSMAASTRLRFSSFTFAVPFITRDTVAGDTPAIRATSLILVTFHYSPQSYFSTNSSSTSSAVGIPVCAPNFSVERLAATFA